jgi:hypothetical protein
VRQLLSLTGNSASLCFASSLCGDCIVAGWPFGGYGEGGREGTLEPAEKQAAKEYLAPNCVPKDTVPFEVPHCLRRR